MGSLTEKDVEYDMLILLLDIFIWAVRIGGFLSFLWLILKFYDISRRHGYDENGNEVVWKKDYYKKMKLEQASGEIYN